MPTGTIRLLIQTSFSSFFIFTIKTHLHSYTAYSSLYNCHLLHYSSLPLDLALVVHLDLVAKTQRRNCIGYKKPLLI